MKGQITGATPSQPLVSVIVPTYNHEKLIRHSLRSIAEQDYRPIEVLVCDDESTDNTCGVVESLGYDFVRYILVPHTGMPPATMNAGLKEAKGEIIMFLDGDDQWLPGKVRKQVDHFLAHPECDFLFGDAWYVVTRNNDYILPDPAIDTTSFTYNPPPRVITPGVIFPLTPIPPLTVAFRRSVLDAGILPDPSMRYSWDVKFSAMVLLEGFQAAFLKEPLGIYRKHAGNTSGSWHANNQIVEDYLQLIELVKDYLPSGYYHRQKERWKYEYIKQSVRHRAIATLSGVRSSPYYPSTFIYRLKSIYYWVYIRTAFWFGWRPPS